MLYEVITDGCSEFELAPPVLDRLGYMRQLRLRSSSQIGYGESDFKYTVIGPGRKAEPGDRGIKEIQ